MEKNPRLRFLSYLVIAYMLLAFSWWSYLLYVKNNDAFRAKVELNRLIMVARYGNEADYTQTAEYRQLARAYEMQEWMILGEALVFVASLLTGMYLINRSYVREMDVAAQRRNFLLSVSHELKSPIASIRLVLETLQKRLLQPEQVQKLTGNALGETERLHSLVDNLLLAARVESTYATAFEPLALLPLAQRVVDTLLGKHPDCQIRLEASEQVPSLQADKSGITSVLVNLLENAVKYSERPAHIALKIRPDESGKFMLIDVADQGIGIPDGEKERVFEKFYRIGNENTRKTKGTGLGLYIVGQIVKAHRGRIRVADNAPRGTVFRVELPLSQ